MTDGLGREREFSDEEKKRIAKKLIKKNKKMAPLNRKLAEEYFVEDQGEADK